jgi:putative transposase
MRRRPLHSWWGCKAHDAKRHQSVLPSVDVVISQEYNFGMKIKKAFQFKLKVSDQKIQQLQTYAGHCRFLWNKCLAINLHRLQCKQFIMRYNEMDYWSKLYKKSDEYGFLSECPAHILQQKLKDLDRAFMDAFDKNQPNKRMPKFRKKGFHDSFRFPEPKQIQLEYNRIKLPKLGWLHFHRSEAIKGELKNVTVSKKGNGWYISIQVETEVSTPLRQATSALAIDLGVSHFAATSEGELISPINSFKLQEHRLAVAQRRLAKKKKYSSNWKLQQAKIRNIHKKIADTRKDYLHKTSTRLSKNHAMIVIEDLKVGNMSRSASGTIEKPGKNVNAKSGLNKSILDQGWYEFRRQLGYKLEWKGGILVTVNPQFTSQKCSACHHVAKENRQSQSEFKCIECGFECHADINASHNILAAGHAVLACGASAVARH